MKVIELPSRRFLMPSWVEGFELYDLEEEEFEPIKGNRILLDILEELGLDQMEEE